MKIGFIGLGAMGVHMAANAAQANFDITGFDVRPEAREMAQSLGLAVSDTLQECVRGADIVGIMVYDDAQVRGLIGGATDILPLLAPDAVVVIHSTVNPETVIAAVAEARNRQIVVIDAPVSGGEHGAKAGTLTYMVGAEPDTFAVCLPLFQAGGEKILHCGSAPSGTVVKIINNAVAFMNISAASEGFRLGTAAGIDLETLQSVIGQSSGESRAVRSWQRYHEIMAQHPGGSAGWLEILRKDLGLASDFAQTKDVDVPNIRLTMDRLGHLFD